MNRFINIFFNRAESRRGPRLKDVIFLFTDTV